MAIRNPPEDVRAFLHSKTINARVLSSGTNLFACAPRVAPGIPAKAVFVWAGAGGAAPIPYMGVSRSVWYPRLQIRVRGDPDTLNETRLAARAAMQLLHRALITGYASALINESEPIDLGEGLHGGPEFGLNLDLIFGE